MNMNSNEEGRSNIQELFRGVRVLITGGTGFMGQVLVEKLLRTCHEIDKVYLLVRPKKGELVHERCEELFSGALFDKLKRERPDYRKKVVLITGDCCMPCLGLSVNDRAMLVQDVNIVFHAAATVRFDEELRKAFYINVLGVKGMLDLAREMLHLKAFVHFSTAYSNCPKKVIDEKFYSPPLNWRELLELLESLNEDMLNSITPVVLGDWPNTYTFTKSVAEDVIREIGKGLPVSIIRPSIVISTAQEPLVAWNNSLNGVVGMALTSFLGLLRSSYCDSDVLTDMVPVDMAVNAAIAVAWDVAQWWSESRTLLKTEENVATITEIDNEGSQEDIFIFNCVSSTQKPVTWGKFIMYSECSLAYPSSKTLWYYGLALNKHRIIHSIYVMLLHFLPALLIDTAASILGKKPILLKIYRKIHRSEEIISYFSTKQWLFYNNNIQCLWKKMSLQDKILFDFNISAMDWEVYFFYMIKGFRAYILEEDFGNLESCKQRLFRLKGLHYGIKYTVWFLASAVAFTVFFVYLNVYMKKLEFGLYNS